MSEQGRGANGSGGNRPEPSGATGTSEDGRAVADLTARVAELEDLRLRALADADNLRKRCAAQVMTAEADAAARVAAQWLPVVDNLERALAHAQADPGSIIEGVMAVRDQATGVLAQLGFPRRDDLGATFDPARHEAVAARPDPAARDNSVIEVVRPAYGEDERQLRPAQVVVAKAD
jgi:molecular chaperone GrpE